uniref:Putative apolipophorin n=1 Tax=Corethrella appendiculata TaxID=1370023 RepID=W4VRP6_9DIPT
MIRNNLLKGFVIFLILQQSVYAGKCKEGCPNPNKSTKYKFQPGFIYTYALDSNINVALAGADEQETTLKVQGSVQIYAGTDCKYLLKIDKLVVISPDGKKSPIGPEIGKPVQFTLSNDELAPEICAEVSDTDHSLNIKRGIISLLQSVDEHKSFETDVFGVCPTHITSHTSGEFVSVSKTRQLNSCGHRETFNDGFFSSIINEHSGIKSTPFLNGEYNSDMKIKNGILDSVVSIEEYSYLPFSTSDAGARAKVVTKFTLKDSKQGQEFKIAKGESKTILFEKTVGTTAGNAEDVKSVLKNLVEKYQNNVGAKAASDFTELIRLMRFTKSDELAKMYQQVNSGAIHNNKPFTRKVFFDALFRVGTGASVTVLANLLKSKELNAEEQKLLYLSFNLVKSMNKESLAAINKLIDGSSSNEAFLAVGTLVNKYCESHYCEGDVLKKVSEEFVKKLDDCKVTTKAKEDTVVAVLKGIKNSNHLAHAALNKVILCTSDKTTTRVRVAALQAYHAGACNKEIQSSALTLLKNIEEDSEIRIEAYLALAECPTATVANEIKVILDAEKSYQVGSFMQSHLASLRASTEPSKESARFYLKGIRSSNKFPTDFRRYSFNNEFSYAVNALGLGTSVDTSVIYSHKSFLPRSSKFNVTTELFGSSFNIFEFNARQENLDLFFEHYFGPKGIFQTNYFQTFITKAMEHYKTLSEKAKTRFRRGIKEDVEKFAKTVNLGNDVIQDLKLDLSLKFFGSELFFLSIGDTLPDTPEKFFDKFFDCLDKNLEKAKHFEHTFEHHALFMDSDFVYPTSVGLPLKLSTQGSGFTRLEVVSEVDIKELIKSPESAKFHLKLVPSANFILTGTLSVDAYTVATGLQVSGSVHTSTGSDINFSRTDDGNTVDVFVGSPLKKQEIFSFEHKIVFITRERGKENIEIPLKFSSPRKTFDECFDQLHEYIGVTFCTGFDIITPQSNQIAPFPLSGPNKFTVFLEIVPHYQFKSELNTKDPKHQSLLLTFDTPKADKARTTTLKLESFYDNDVYVRATLTSPRYNAFLETGLKNNKEEVALYAKANNNGDEYLAKLGFSKHGDDNHAEYKPIVLIDAPKIPNAKFNFKVDGSIIVDKIEGGNKYTLKDILVTPTNGSPLKIDGVITQEGKKIGTDLTLAKDGKEGTVKGSVELDVQFINLEYAIVTNFYEPANGKITYQMARTENSLKNHLIIVPGKDFTNTKNGFEFYQNVVFEIEDKKLKSLQFQNKYNCPKVEVKLDGDFNKQLFKLDVGFGYDKNKFATLVDAKYNLKVVGDYDVVVSGTLNKHNFKYIGKRTIDAGKSKLVNKFTTNSGTQIELNGLFGHRFTSQEADVNLEAVFIAVDKAEPYKLALVIQVDPKAANSNAKVTVGKTEYITYDAKVKRGATGDGTFKLIVKDILSGEGSYKSVSGKGDATALVTFNKLDRTLKVESKFYISSPTYDIETDFYYDFEKDNTRKVHFATKNQIQPSGFDSKNNLEVFSEKYEFNVLGNRDGSPTNGKLNWKFDLTLPTGRLLAGDFERNRETKGEKLTGNVVFKLTDQLPSKKARTFSVNGKLNEADVKSNFYDVEYTVKYKDLEDKTVDVESHIKHLPKDHFKTALVYVKVFGTLVQNPFNFNVDIDEYCSKHAIYHLTGNYGDDADVKLDGKFYVSEKSKPATHEFKGSLNLKQGTFKNLKIESSWSFLEPVAESDLYEMKYSGLVGIDEDVLSVSTTGKGNLNHGSGEFSLALPKRDPLNAKVSYAHSEKENEVTNTKGTFELNYGQNKNVKFDGVVDTKGGNEVSVHAKFNSDIQGAKNVDFTFKNAKTNENTYTTNSKLVSDDKSYGFNSVLVVSDTQPSIDITMQYPSKNVQMYGAYNRLGDRKFKCELKLLNFGDFDFDGKLETGYKSFDTFYIKSDIDSVKLKLDKVHFEINPKVGSHGKGIEFKATSNDKNVLSGYADYTVKEEKGTTILEGSGNVKIYNEQKTASFKFMRNKFEEAKHGETGVSYVLNGLIGPKNIVTEIKLTNKNFNVKYTVCEEKKQCINIDIKSVLKSSDIENFEHQLLISIDLRELGYSHEFGLKAETARQKYVIDHTVDVHLQSQDKPQYQYSVYLHPDKAGAVLTLPSRVVALEGVFVYPKQQIFGKYDTSVSLYLDKDKAPTNKATIGFTGETKQPTKNAVAVNGKLKFSHPAVKALAISGQGQLDGDKQSAEGTLTFDIFKAAAQKLLIKAKYVNNDHSGKGFNVTSEASISSKGLGIDLGFNGHSALSLETKRLSIASSLVLPVDDFKFGSYLYASPEEFEFLVKRFNDELVHTTGNFNLNKHSADFTTVFKFFGATPIEFKSQVQGFTLAKFSVKKDKLVNIDGGFELGKNAHLTAVSDGKELFKGTIALDQTHFLTSQYKVEEAEIKSFLKNVNTQTKEEYNKIRGEIENKFTKADEELKTVKAKVQNALPDFNDLKTDYTDQLKKLSEELMADKSIKEFVDFISTIYLNVVKTLEEFYKIYAENFKKVNEILQGAYEKINEYVKLKVLPAIKEAYSKVESTIYNIYEETLNLLSATLERVVKALKTFEGDFNKIAKTISDVFKKFAETLNKYFETLEKELADLYQLISDYITSLPGFEMAKEKYNEFFETHQIKEYFLGIFEEVITVVKELKPTPAVGEFLEEFKVYVETKVKQQPINDIEALKKLYVSFVSAVRSVVDLLRSQYGEHDTPTGIFSPLPFSMDSLKRIPYVTSIKFSPFNYLRNEKLFSLRDFFTLYRPYGWNVFALLPPFTLRGHVADGSHIFTFDHKHLTFPGSCAYILAQDFVNGNFSIVANLENGKLASVTLVDKEDTVELFKDGVVKLNGKATEFPVHNRNIHAWRRYYSASLLTRYGAELQCTLDLRVCHFTVSGYYLGKIRGLLGNGNHEPFDDFTLPQGKITDDYSVFGNAYKVQSSCADVAAHGHDAHAHANDYCTKFFTPASSLRYCFMFKDQTNYREACEHATHDAENKLDAACNIAFLYASACRLDKLPATLPAECAKCSKVDVGDAVSVKTPQKKADVVIVVDTAVDSILTDLAQPVITDLRKEFRQRDINDINIAVIGYNNDELYISRYTTNGKLDFTGKLTPSKSTGPKRWQPAKTGDEKIDEFFVKFHEICRKSREDLGFTTDAVAFRESVDYPFRSDAVKVILAIRSDNLEYSANPTKLFGGAIVNGIAKVKGIHVHVVTPVKDLTLSGNKDSKQVKSVVGFDNKSVLQLSDVKSKGEYGSTDLKSKLKYDSDMGVDFVEESGGYIFVLQNFNQLKSAKEKKPFISVLAGAIADQAARTETHSDCVCELKYGLFAEEHCEAKETKLLPPIPRKVGARG